MKYVAINSKQQLLQIRAAEGPNEWTEVIFNPAKQFECLTF